MLDRSVGLKAGAYAMAQFEESRRCCNVVHGGA